MTAVETAAAAVGVDTPAPYIAAVPPSDLFADPAYQRDLDLARVARMATEFDRRLLGVLEVSARSDGRYAILDGQHRHALVQAVYAGRTPPSLVCQVYEGLSVDEEARLFHEINVKRKALTWWGRWKAQRASGDEGVLAIEQVLANHGLQVNPAASAGNVRAVAALRLIVDELGDLELLDGVLVVLLSAFGPSFDALDGSIMQGLAYVLANYDIAGNDPELDLDRLVVQLREIPPRQLRARAAMMREAHRGTIGRLCAAVIVERYNSGRGRKIDPFFTRVPSLSQRRGIRYSQHHRRPRAAVDDAAPETSGAGPSTGPRPASATSAAATLPPSPPVPTRPGSQARTAPARVPDSQRPGGEASLAGQSARAPTPAASSPMLAMCRCGHTMRRHDGGDGACEVADGADGCTEFTEAS